MQLACTSDDSRGKRTDPVKHMSLRHCLTQPEDKFMHSSIKNENICIISEAQNMTALQPNEFLTLNTSVTCHKLWTVAFHRAKSTANSTFTICIKSLAPEMDVQIVAHHLCKM